MDLLAILRDSALAYTTDDPGSIADSFDLQDAHDLITATGSFSFIDTRLLPCFEEYFISIKQELGKRYRDDEDIRFADYQAEAYHAFHAGIRQLQTELDETVNKVQMESAKLGSLFRSYRATGQHSRLRHAMHCQTMCNEARSGLRGYGIIRSVLSMMEEMALDLPEPDVASMMERQRVMEAEADKWKSARDDCKTADIQEDLDTYTLADLLSAVKRRKRLGKIKSERNAQTVVEMPSQSGSAHLAAPASSCGIIFHLNTYKESQKDFENTSLSELRRLAASQENMGLE